MNVKKPKREIVPKRLPPARNPQQREQQLINYAVDLAEEQLRMGTASSQVITHYLKLATEREKAEVARIRMETDLKHSKISAIEDAKEREAIYTRAIEAMQSYRIPQENEIV